MINDFNSLAKQYQFISYLKAEKKSIQFRGGGGGLCQLIEKKRKFPSPTILPPSTPISPPSPTTHAQQHTSLPHYPNMPDERILASVADHISTNKPLTTTQIYALSSLLALRISTLPVSTYLPRSRRKPRFKARNKVLLSLWDEWIRVSYAILMHDPKFNVNLHELCIAQFELTNEVMKKYGFN